MLKRLIRSPAGSFLLSMMIATVMWLVVRSLRWTHVGRTEFVSRLASGQPEIVVFWHEHLFVMSPVMPAGCSVLQSPHPDGRVIAGASRLFGPKPVWGSSNKNPMSGLRKMVGEIKAGRFAVITPDGPRGPARQLSMGPISLAQLTGARITLVAWSADRCWHAKSWDKMRVPKPFSRIICRWSEPIELPRTKSKTELEQQRQMIERRLNAFVQTTDQQITDKQTS